MFFYVYLEPKVIEIARDHGELGLQALIGVLLGFLENCFVADFEDERGWNEVRDLVNGLDDDDNRKRIKEILTVMYKRNRLIGCLSPDYAGERRDVECLIEQARGALLDLLLMSELGEYFDGFTEAETSTLEMYQRTRFARERADMAGGGVTMEDGELDEIAFLNRFLLKALKHAHSIEICDRIFGEKYGGNYRYTAGVFFEWLEQNLEDPANCRIVIHCGVPDEERIEQLKGHLKSLKRDRLAGTTLQLCFYDPVSFRGALPHDRFIVTDQIAIGLPRGMDFLNERTRKTRDLTMDYKKSDQVNRLIASYSAGKRPEIDL
jgi:hypothetical protein